jgi:CheY-like chemotaxis protein
VKKILVIEDNETNLYLIRFILEQKGYTVVAATTGLDGIARAVDEKPDLIIMDIQLPDIDGLEATKRIRASEADGEIPIVALTSYAMDGDEEKALTAGCTGYLTKPIDPDTLADSIAKYLD